MKKPSKRQLEIYNLIKSCEETVGKELYLIYNQFSKHTDVADINFNIVDNNRMSYKTIDSFKTKQETLYNMLDNNLLITKEVNGIKLTTTVKF